MLAVTGITDHRVFAPEGSWLDRYCTAMAVTRFPTSYQLSCGLFALTTVVGRRARMRRGGYQLYPPLSVILLGTSGVGKSRSMSGARKVIEAALEGTDIPFLVDHSWKWTPSGLIEQWAKWQRRGKPGEHAPLEGAYTTDELGALLERSTGTENAPRFFINVLEHDGFTDTTRGRGRVEIKRVGVGFGLCATLKDLRASVPAHLFASGLMHRFLITHERVRPETDESDLDDGALYALGQEALQIRDDAPEDMLMEEGVDQYLRQLQNRAEQRKCSSDLQGFWNRFSPWCLKLGMARAISDSRWAVSRDDVVAGEDLMLRFVYNPLERLVEELAAGPRMAKLYELQEDLHCAGRGGLPRVTVLRKMATGDKRQTEDALGQLLSLELGYTGRSGRYYATQEWASEDGKIVDLDEQWRRAL